MFRKSFIAFVLLALVMSVAGSVFAQDGLVIWADETRAPVLEALGAEFESEFGIAIKVQQLGFGDIRDGFKTAAPAGEGPDIIIGAHDWLGELVVNGLLEPMDLGELAELFVPSALDAFTFDGIVYGLPYATENVAFLYNTELVATPPTTWDEVRTLSEEIVASGAAKYGYIRQDGDPYHFFPIQTAFGGYVFGRDEAGNYLADDLGIDSEGAIAAAMWYQGMVEAGLQPDGVDYDVMHNWFESGDAAMIITGPWALERIRNSGVPYAVTVFPEGPAGASRPFFGAQGFMISAYSDNKELAVAFLTEFVLSQDIEVTTDDGTGTPMVLLGMSRPSAFLPALEMSSDPDFPSFAEAGAKALPMPAIPAMGSVWTAWDQALGSINDKTATAEDAFRQAAEQIRTLIAGS
mgnify:CR=1 FL=1